MYNGIGLNTARGSGTNGYVQRNLSTVNQARQKVDYKTDDELRALDRQLSRPPNAEILDHQRKRQVEVKCLEYREELEDRGLTEEEIERKVRRYRSKVTDEIDDHRRRKEQKFHEFFKDRKMPNDSHQYAELNQEKNDRLKGAFGISRYFVSGSSLDPERKAKEQLARSEADAAREKRYQMVRTPSPEREQDDRAVEQALDQAKKRA